MTTKDTYVICYEGEAEIGLFGFLKNKFCLKNKTFKPELIEGFDSFAIFQRKYNKIIKKWGLKQKDLKQKIHFIFLVDKDLDDSVKIEKFIKGQGNTVQFCDPNIEAVLLKLAGINLQQGTSLKDFRAKCKEKFKEKFGKEAHQMKDSDLIALIKNETIFNSNFPELKTIFS